MILGVQAVFRNWATPCVEREAEQKRTKLSETDSQRDLSCDCIDRKLHLDDAVAVLRWSGFGRNGRVQITCRAHTGQDDSVTRIAVFHQLIEYTCPPKCQHETEVGKESGDRTGTEVTSQYMYKVNHGTSQFVEGREQDLCRETSRRGTVDRCTKGMRE